VSHKEFEIYGEIPNLLKEYLIRKLKDLKNMVEKWNYSIKK